MAANDASALCIDCSKIVTDLLAGTPGSHGDWPVIESEHATLTYFKQHLNGTVGYLRRSAASGCVLCELIDKQLENANELDPRSPYNIFIWGRFPAKPEFQLAVGDVHRFVKHISQWKQPASLLFYQEARLEAPRSSLNSSQPSGTKAPASLPLLPHRNLGSTEMLHMAAEWLEHCIKDHEHCARARTKLPKRVLDLGKSAELSSIGLYQTQGETANYATLSYCWGIKAKRLETRKNTLQHHCKSIPLENLPNTMRDAANIAKALGFQYLWIDSLCIVQDDDQDWAEQSVAMTEIYGGSTLNISASDGTNSDSGILHPLDYHAVSLGSYSRWKTGVGLEEIFVGRPMNVFDLEETPISSRGWVFQERLVSTATLHYTNQGLLWECADRTVMGHDQSCTSKNWKTQWKGVLGGRRPIMQVRSLSQEQINGLASIEIESWNSWVCAYSQRTLYEWHDKFPAMAGVAKKFAHTFDLTYVGGLWQEHLLPGLLWRRHDRQRTLVRFPKYIAPSWSWASVHGQLDYRSVRIFEGQSGPKLEIQDVHLKENHPGTFGSVASGRIVAKGSLQSVVIDRSAHNVVRKEPFQACRVDEGFVNKTNVYCTLDEYVEWDHPLFQCWCLRIGSFDCDGREADAFLLLKGVDGNEFHRIGLAETDPWESVTSLTANSGEFTSGKFSELVLT